MSFYFYFVFKLNHCFSLEPRPCSAQQQEHLSSTQRLSVPVLGPISEKQLNTKLTQRLRQVLRERNQDPAPQEPAAPQRKILGITEDSKGRNSVDWCASTVCTPKEQPAQSNGPAESKGLMSMEADAALIKGPAKVSTTKSLQQQKTPNIKGETNLSSKIKVCIVSLMSILRLLMLGVVIIKPSTVSTQRDAEVAGSMVKLISSRYEINSQSTAKYTAGKIPPSWSPPIVNRFTHIIDWMATLWCCSKCHFKHNCVFLY